MALLWEDQRKKALCSLSVCLPPLRTERPPRSQTPLRSGDLTVTGLQARPSPAPLHQTPVNSKRGPGGRGGSRFNGTEAS
jgi:hypothetical protein